MFFDRKYKLTIGDAATGDGLTIEDLQIKFTAKKSANNKEKIDRCSVSVYNLSDESLAYLETDYPVVIFSCGYKGKLVRLFYGEVVEVETRKRGTDRVTKIEVEPSFTELTHKIISELVPENGTVEDVIEAIRKQTTIGKGVYKGDALKTRIVYGYPLTGSPREMLDRVCDVYNLEWRVDGDVLFVTGTDNVDYDVEALAPVISEKTGLIDRPYFFTGSEKKSTKDEDKKRGVKFMALINPNVVPGSLVAVEYKGERNYYKVVEIDFNGDYRGSNWYMTCVCSERPTK